MRGEGHADPRRALESYSYSIPGAGWYSDSYAKQTGRVVLKGGESSARTSATIPSTELLTIPTLDPRYQILAPSPLSILPTTSHVPPLRRTETMAQRILLIEDEPGIADTIVYALRTEGFDPVWRQTGAEGCDALKDDGFALVVLDIGLPDTSGFDVCREIRGSHDIPVIFLTARAEEIDRVAGLEMGADDYIVKPFSPRELAARVRAVLRRTRVLPVVSGPVARSGADATPFTVDTVQRTISYHGTPLSLSRYEYGILEVLVGSPGRVFSRRELMEQVWDEPEVSLERTVDTHVKMLRTKLRAVRPGHDPIETRRGFGYSLSVHTSPDRALGEERD